MIKILTCEDWYDGPQSGMAEVDGKKLTYVCWEIKPPVVTYKLFDLSPMSKAAWEIYGSRVLDGLTPYGEFRSTEANWSEIDWGNW